MFAVFPHALLSLILIGSIAPAMAQVVVRDARVRGTVQWRMATGAYMTLASQEDLTLVGVTSDVAACAAVREMRMRGDMTTRRPVESLPVPAGHPVMLDEGHYHVMLEGLRTLQAGETVGMDLQFVDSHGVRQVVHVNVAVREIAGHDSGAAPHEM